VELRLNDDLVVYTNKIRNLGMIVDNRLSFSRLWRYADVMPVLTRKRLGCATFSLLLYLFPRVGGV
jgi:hypothetical protein